MDTVRKALITNSNLISKIFDRLEDRKEKTALQIPKLKLKFSKISNVESFNVEYLDELIPELKSFYSNLESIRGMKMDSRELIQERTILENLRKGQYRGNKL